MSSSEPGLRASKPTVFISYSRDDLAFADQLDAALRLTGFSTSIDRLGVSGGERWRERLAILIRDADTVLFVLSPSSAASEICAWEVEEAARLNKRILPVLCRPLQDQRLSPRLAALNYIFFYPEPRAPGSGFGVGLGQLVSALRTDLEWLREHTRLLQRATEWDEAGRPLNRLLSGVDVGNARAWAVARPADAPEPTELHLDFIKASEQAEIQRASVEAQRLRQVAAAQEAQSLALLERESALRMLSRRTAAGLAGAGVLTTAAAGLAYWGVNAEARFRRAQAEAEAAAENSAERARQREAMRTDIEGQLVTYASSPGQLADDGPPGTNSPYTSAVLAELRSASGSLQEALARANKMVLNTSRTSQRPLLSSDLNGDIYLTRKSQTSRRMALIVTVGRLSPNEVSGNPRLDGDAWRVFLTEAGFETAVLHEPSLAQCRATMDRLVFASPRREGSRTPPLIWTAGLSVDRGTPAPKDTLVLFFYAGVGAYRGGFNYLMMADTSFDRPDELWRAMLPVAELQEWARRISAASVIILDTNFTDIAASSR